MHQLEEAGNEFLMVTEGKAGERCWGHWRRAVEIRSSERIILERVGLRVMGEVMDIWNRHA